MNVLRAAMGLARKDLRIELRSGEVTVTTAFFAVLVAVLTSLSFYVDDVTALRVASGVLWLSLTFAGVLAMGRSWSRERENDMLRALVLSPIPRPAIYLGKALGTCVFLGVVLCVLVPVVGVLYHVPVREAALSFVLLVLGMLGFVFAGTLFAAMTVRTRARDLMLSIVIFPLVSPALLAGVVATRELFNHAPLAEVVSWAQILLAFDLVFFVVGLFLFEPLVAD